MLEQVLQELNNWFCVSAYEGKYTVANGLIDLPFLQPGQYFRILGSVFNDGVYQYITEPTELKERNKLIDETFIGVIWALAIPPALLVLTEAIEKWEKQYGDIVNKPYQSESFGGYSYTKASGLESGWRSAFKKQLNPYRKIKLF